MENTALAVSGRSLDRQDLVGMWRASLQLDVDAGNISEATAATYRRGLQRFIAWGQANPERATDHAVKEWLAFLRLETNARGQQNKPAAISAWFAGVRAFFRWAVSEGHLKADPTAGVKRARRHGTTEEHERELLTDDEMLRVLGSKLSCRDRAFVHLLAYTGARGVELYRADIEDLRTEGGELVLRVQGKGRIEKTERVIIAHPDAKDAIYSYLAERGASSGPLFVSESNRSNGERLSSRAMRAIIRKILDDAGVTSRNKTTHSFRHSAITNAITNGASLLEAQAMARHTDPATTKRYFHNLERIKNAAERKIDYKKA
jgi:integrase/recombinase XerC/integrase/recombinase XerD